MKADRDRINFSKRLPRTVQLTRDSWCETVWSEVAGKTLRLPNIKIDLSQFPKIRVKPVNGQAYSIHYKPQHRYIRIPLGTKENRRSYLVLSCCGQKYYFDFCTYH